MIQDAFIDYHASRGQNGRELLARLRSPASEKDAEAWRILIAWAYSQCIFTQYEISRMLGISISSLRRRITRYKK